MRTFVLTILFFLGAVAHKLVLAAPSAEQILNDSEQAYSFAVDWLYDLFLPIIGLMSFAAIIAFWLRSFR